MLSLESFKYVHWIVLEILTIGTTFSGSPSIFTDLAGLSNFTKRVSSTSFPRTPLWDVQPAINPSWPLVMHNSVTSLFLIITGIPIQRGSLSGKWAVAAWGRFHMRSCSQGLIALEECLLALFDFLPLCFFSDTSGEFPKWSTEWKFDWFQQQSVWNQIHWFCLFEHLKLWW